MGKAQLPVGTLAAGAEGIKNGIGILKLHVNVY
jgi:hypothetical protein